MRIELRKLTNDMHELRCLRDDGSVEVAQLETRSLLVHDLTHLAFEQQAGLQKSFWGSVASGKTFNDLRETFTEPTDQLKLTETLIGPLQAVMQGKVSAEQYLMVLEQLFSAQKLVVPVWLTVDLVQSAKQYFHHLYGEWNALPFGEVMVIDWNLHKSLGKVS